MESRSYDKILKENIEEIIIPLLDKWLGQPIRIRRRLTEKLQTTTEREADFLAEVESEIGGKFLLHIEFQTKAERDMIYRVGEYHAIIQRKYRLPIKHLVILLGKRPLRMRNELPEEEVFRSFEILSLHDFDYRDLALSSVAGEVILAILADFKNRKPEVVVRLLKQRLIEICNDHAQLKKYVRQLTELSRLRNLEELVIKTFEAMPITYDVSKDYLYNRGIQEGKEQGLEKGIAHGMEQGIEIGSEQEKRQIAINCLYSGLSPELTAQLTGLSKEEVLAIWAGAEEEEEE